ncbi:MAG: trypsin-like serine protease [Myxococcota bacterium]
MNSHHAPRLAVLLPALLTGTIAGCDAEPDSLPTPTEIEWQLSDGEFPRQDGDTTICSVRHSEIDGELQERAEVYLLPRMNAELAEDPDWRAFFGLDRVTNCDEARDYGPAQRDYELAHDKRLRPPASAEGRELAPEEPRSVAVEPDAMDPGDSEFRVGEATFEANVDAVVTWGAGGTNTVCSGTFINNRAILTAAHCLAPDGVKFIGITREENGVVQPPFLALGTTYRHPSWTGVSDPGDDVALIVFEAPIPGVDNGFDTMRVMTSPIQQPDPIAFHGWGFLTHEGTGDGVMRTGVVNVNGAMARYFYDIVYTGGARPCRGDSGGPATLHANTGVAFDMVGGVWATFQNGSANCPYPGDAALWAQTSDKAVWIESKLSDHGMDFTTSGSTICHRFSSAGRNYMRCF